MTMSNQQRETLTMTFAAKRTDGVFILRGQPIHRGHIRNIREALKRIDGNLYVIFGSAGSSVSIKNPFGVITRMDMLAHALRNTDIDSTRILVRTVNDSLYNDTKWQTDVRQVLMGGNVKYIFGHNKDNSSFYLNIFPELEFVELGEFTTASGAVIHATSIRNALFTHGELTSSIRELLPPGVDTIIEGYMQTDNWVRLREDWEYYQMERLKFAGYPYPEALNCCTADPVVICDGYVLLVQRRSAPGRGLVALPGGHKEANESFLQCAMRELREETGLKVPEKVLRGSIKQQYMFDNPGRSMVFCKPSMAYHIEIQPNPDGKLPKVKAGSDAVRAEWVSLAWCRENRTRFYDDHFEIISHFTGI
ncbi:cytidyltransferase [Vibrio phage EniLVp02]